MKAMNDFAAAMRVLFAEPLDDATRRQRVKPLLGTMLAAPDLIASAERWPTSEVKTNLLFYQDPSYGFVVNGLIKDPNDATPIHDHTWTAYGVIEGMERVYNFAVKSGDGDRAIIEPAGEYVVAPRHVEVVPPNFPHAEIAQTRSAAVIVRSERLSGFKQRIFDADAGTVRRLPGPTPIAFELVA